MAFYYPSEHGASWMKIVGNPSVNWSPLKRLAGEFHQDFGVLDINVETAAARHISTLNPEQRQLLKEELTRFLANHPGKSNKGITNAWAKMGAHSWTGDLTAREMLNIIWVCFKAYTTFSAMTAPGAKGFEILIDCPKAARRRRLVRVNAPHIHLLAIAMFVVLEQFAGLSHAKDVTAESSCLAIAENSAGETKTVELTSLHVLDQTSKPEVFTLPADAPLQTRLIMCGRASIVPAPTDAH